VLALHTPMQSKLTSLARVLNNGITN